MRRHLVLVAVFSASLALTACALRPRLNEVVKTSGSSPGENSVTFLLVDSRTGAPIPGARVSASDGHETARATSDQGGRVKLVWSERIAAANPLVVIDLPAGVPGYKIQPVPVVQVPALSSPPAPAAPPPAAAGTL